MRSPLLVLIGAGFGVALVLSCGDDAAPSGADAQTACDCPAAEPPLAGRITLSVETTTSIPAGELGSQSNGCPIDGIVLSGSCRLEGADVSILSQISLAESGIDVLTEEQSVWHCLWRNPTGTEVTGKVRAVCLMPAEPAQ